MTEKKDNRWAMLCKLMVKAVEKTNDGKLRFPVYCGQVM